MGILADSKEAIRSRFLESNRPRMVPTKTPGIFLRVLPLGVMVDEIYPVSNQDRDVTIPILARALCFEDGSPLFDTGEEAEQALRQCSGKDLVDMVKEAMVANGIGAIGADDAKKNSTAPIPDTP